MNTASKVGIKAIRTVDAFINTSILAVILLLFAFGTFALWDTNQIHSVACSSRYERYRPTAETTEGGVSFASLQAMNSDVFAWLTVFGTNIDYPVVQGRDNMRYVNTNIHGQHSLAGAIFLDYRSCRSFTNFSSIIHGHHMANRVMFGEISMFHDQQFFESRQYGTLFFDGQEHGIDFFAFIHVDAHDRRIYNPNTTTEEEKQAHLDLIMSLAVNSRDIGVTTSDRLVLLSTCSPGVTHMRDLLVGRITSEIQPDAFYVPRENVVQVLAAMANIDSLPDIWSQIGAFGQLAVIIFVLLIILLGCFLLVGKKCAIAVGISLLLVVTISQTVYANAFAPTDINIPVYQTAPSGQVIHYLFAPVDNNLDSIAFSLTGNGSIVLGPLIFNAPGFFNFELSVTSAPIPGVIMDTTVYRVEIIVLSDGSWYVNIWNGAIKVYSLHYVHRSTDGYDEPTTTVPTTTAPTITTMPPTTTEPYEPTTTTRPPIDLRPPTHPHHPDGPYPPVTEEDDDDYHSPQTGDTSNPAFWIFLMTASMAMIIAMLTLSHKMRKERQY